MQTELECLEETLEKRRAELREADKRLRDCRGDLEQARGDAEEMILHYDSVKAQLDERSSELELLGLYLFMQLAAVTHSFPVVASSEVIQLLTPLYRI